jgi:hypothetical protein
MIWISMTPSVIGDGLIPVLEYSNWTSLMIHLYFEIDIDDDNYLYQLLFDNTCMMLSTLICLKLV